MTNHFFISMAEADLVHPKQQRIDVLCCAVQVTMVDFEAALDEVQPAFGANTETLQKHVMQVKGQGGKGYMMQRGGGCY